LFSSRERTDELVQSLTNAGLPAIARPFHLGQRDVQQIVLGPFDSRGAAASDLQRLKALGGYNDARIIQ
jgi:cell division septation protein DedD